MKKSNKIITMIMIIVSTIFLVTASTFAYWYWSGIDKAKNLVVNIGGGVRDSDIIYDAGESHFVGNFQPKSNFCDSASTTISFSKKERVKDVNLAATIHMDINSIGENISLSDDIYWVVTSGDNISSCGAAFVNADVNLDGVINDSDVVAIENFVNTGVSNFPETNDTSILYGDINLDGIVNTADYSYLSQYITDSESYPLTDTNLFSNSVLNYGTFKGVADGDLLNLLENVMVGTETQTFTVWLWIDSAGDTISNISGESIDTNVWTEMSVLYNVPNKPVLDDAMIPVKISNDGSLKTVSPDDPSWYNYYSKQWANIVLVGDETKREYYLSNLDNNVSVDTEDVVEYFVWIPRYKYRIPSNTVCSDIKNPTYEKYPECYGAPYKLTVDESELDWDSINEVIDYYGIDSSIFLDSLLSTGAVILDDEDYGGSVFRIDYVLDKSQYVPTKFNGNNLALGDFSSVDIEFETKKASMALGNATRQYRSHPSFWYDKDKDNYVDSNEALAGIWIGKFDATIPIGGDTVAILPNVSYDGVELEDGEWHDPPYLDECFAYYDFDDYAFNHNTTGLDFTSLKRASSSNNEVGAVMYLTYSKYGKNADLASNNGNKSGCGMSSVYGQCADEYGSGVSVYPQSTTGNITGIFDIAGGYDESVESTNIEQYYNAWDGEETGMFSAYLNCPNGICYGWAVDEISSGFGGFLDIYFDELGDVHRDGLHIDITACPASTTHVLMINVD